MTFNIVSLATHAHSNTRRQWCIPHRHPANLWLVHWPSCLNIASPISLSQAFAQIYIVIFAPWLFSSSATTSSIFHHLEQSNHPFQFSQLLFSIQISLYLSTLIYNHLGRVWTTRVTMQLSTSFLAAALPLLAAAAPAPVASSGPIGLLATHSASPIHLQIVNAAGQNFWIGKDTSSYCPLTPASSCPPGNSTIIAVFGDEAHPGTAAMGKFFFQS